jgi:hypothetical protein
MKRKKKVKALPKKRGPYKVKAKKLFRDITDVVSDIPIPEFVQRQRTYPFKDMKRGQSFAMKLVKGDNPKKVCHLLQARAKADSPRKTWRFVTAIGKKEVRIWRVQ